MCWNWLYQRISPPFCPERSVVMEVSGWVLEGQLGELFSIHLTWTVQQMVG